MRVFRFTALLLALTLAAAAPGFAAQPRGAAPAARPTSALASLRGFLVSLWNDAGCLIDPLGRCLTRTGLHLLADRRLVAPPVGVVGDPTRRLGSGRRTLLRYEPKKSRLYVNDVSDSGLGFSGISPEVYRLRIGGYNVLAGWLVPRGGRVLLPEEILTFRRIASALTLTLEVQEKIAEAGGGYGEAS